jgi:hypothetical protein
VGNKEKAKVKPKRDRYWSVMLVGDHGRVIPFKHFKTLAIGICLGFMLALIAVVVLVVLYAGQGQKLEQLNARLEEALNQNSKLRDEKDLYLTQLMVKKNQSRDTANKPAVPEKTEPKNETKREKPVPSKPETKPAALQKIKKEPPEKQPPKVQWKADIRRISVSYDPKREVLNAQFRIYNRSKPKKALSGRSVVVFKAMDDPPIKWFSVPRVQLSDGRPSGKRGQAFKINNYRTMKFRAYRQKAPIHYNMAAIYVFSGEGQLLASKDFAFKIDYTPPVKKVETKPEPTKADTETQSTEKAGTDSDAGKPPEASPAAPPVQEKPAVQDKKEEPVGPTVPPIPEESAVGKQTPASQETAPSGDSTGASTESTPGGAVHEEKPAGGVSTEAQTTTQPPVTAPKPQSEGEPQ